MFEKYIFFLNNPNSYKIVVYYFQAVTLIKQAIELDSRNQLSAALSAYTASLRLLVPCAIAERDAVRRAALSDKLTRCVTRSLGK